MEREEKEYGKSDGKWKSSWELYHEYLNRTQANQKGSILIRRDRRYFRIGVILGLFTLFMVGVVVIFTYCMIGV